MDLLFKRYASPFLLVDPYIRTHRFTEFITEFLELREEDLMWEIWLHKIEDKSFEEFKESVKGIAKNQEFTKEQIETTINDSAAMLNNFNPNEKG